MNKRESRRRPILSRYLSDMKHEGIGGLSGGNNVELITDGDVCYNEFFESIDKALSTINLETYIFRSDKVGWAIAEKLAAAAKRGLEVNFLYDAIGCLTTDKKIFTYLRASGVEVVEYRPLVPWRLFWNITLRDHRKILVIDGRRAFIGGLNISQEYAGPAFNGMNWRDTHIKVEGPAVRDIQFFFIENWFRNGGKIVDYADYFPSVPKHGRELLMVLCTKARRNVRPIHVSYLSAINNARESILISNAYFLPDMRIIRSLINAVQRGVSVKLMLPRIYAVPVIDQAARYLYPLYLRNNIEIYEYTRSVLHAKTAVIDGIWTTIGSSNLDRLSFRVNLEINAVILGDTFGAKMARLFYEDLQHCERVTTAAGKRIRGWMAYRFRNIL